MAFLFLEKNQKQKVGYAKIFIFSKLPMQNFQKLFRETRKPL